MTKEYRPWTPEQDFLLPPSPMQWLPEGHLAYFVLDLVRELDVAAIDNAIQSKDGRGVRPYSPRMMTALLLYAYCVGVFSSRKVERATYEDVAFRVLSAPASHPRSEGSAREGSRRSACGRPPPGRSRAPRPGRVRTRCHRAQASGHARRQPVFGQIKEGRGFRRFSLRGLAKAGAEWAVVCLCHNLLKLYRAAPNLAQA